MINCWQSGTLHEPLDDLNELSYIDVNILVTQCVVEGMEGKYTKYQIIKLLAGKN